MFVSPSSKRSASADGSRTMGYRGEAPPEWEVVQRVASRSVARPAYRARSVGLSRTDGWDVRLPRRSGRVPRSVPTVRRSAGCDGRRRRSRRSVSIVCPGATILRQGADPAAQLFVLRDGLVDLYDDERIVDHLSEGEVFGLSVLSGLGPALSVRARDEVRCLLIPADRAAEVLGTREGLAYLAASVARWAEGASVEHHLRRAQAGEDLAEAIRGAGDVDEVVAASTGLPATIRSLLGDRVDPVDIGHVVGCRSTSCPGGSSSYRPTRWTSTTAPSLGWPSEVLPDMNRHSEPTRTTRSHTGVPKKR